MKERNKWILPAVLGALLAFFLGATCGASMQYRRGNPALESAHVIVDEIHLDTDVTLAQDRLLALWDAIRETDFLVGEQENYMDFYGALSCDPEMSGYSCRIVTSTLEDAKENNNEIEAQVRLALEAWDEAWASVADMVGVDEWQRAYFSRVPARP